jgi:hypothetical protein
LMPAISRQTPKGNEQSPRPLVQRDLPGVLGRIGPISFEDEGLKVLVYGQSGTGKTTFASTFPARLLWLVCSGSVKPGELRSINTAANKDRVHQVVLQSTAEIGEIVAHIKETWSYATVVLDHASGLQDLTIKEILGLDEVPLVKYKAAGKGQSWGLVTQQQYGQSSLRCKEIFRDLLGLPCNVVIVAQERTFGGGEGDQLSDVIQPTVGASMTPSVTGWLGPACDYVVQTYKRPKMEQGTARVGDKEITTQRRGRGAEFCLRTGPHDVFQTKFRLPLGTPLPDSIVDPTYSKILALINGGGGA